MVSCEKAALEALADAVPAVKHEAWVAEVAAARKKFEEENETFYAKGMSYADAVHPAVIAKELTDFMYRGNLPKEQTTFVSGGYGVAREWRRWLAGDRPGRILNGRYQYGAIGPDVGYTFGAAVAGANRRSVPAPYKSGPGVCGPGRPGHGAHHMDTRA